LTTINSYDIGVLVRCSAVFTDTTGAAIDPSAVKFKFKTPAGAITMYTYGTNVQLVKDGVGHYHVDISVTTNGDWLYRYESTGSGQAAEESTFFVRDSAFD